MAVTNRLTVFCALVSMVLLFGCAGMKSSGMDYDYSDGWLSYEYNVPMQQAYVASMHGAYSEQVAFNDDVTWDPAPEIAGTLNGQPVMMKFAETAPGKTTVSVKVTEAGDQAAATQIQEGIQRYIIM